MNSNTRWLAGILFTVVLLLSGWLYTGLSNGVERTAAVNQAQGEDIAMLKAQYKAIDGRLARIESGIDRIAEQLRRERP